MAPARVVLATRNPGKLRELSAMFLEAGIALDDLASVGLAAEDPEEDALETFDTFEENARAKARWFSSKLPGALVVADDSGLAVDSLGGAPGVHSKRWSGSGANGAALEAANNAHLLARLGPAAARTAGYVCVVVCTDGGREWSARGECRGRILTAPSGTGGFGYDPLFWSDDLQCSFGDATREAKARVSHRGRAFRALLERLVPRAAPRAG
ncbi:MAG: non-canonical purine NTP pyrophosphatase [Gemmatimonadetes bacterium]|nr:non-canonical purine NTP pyrophosphatase [Gemmatimonadota bacterium]